MSPLTEAIILFSEALLIIVALGGLEVYLDHKNSRVQTQQLTLLRSMVELMQAQQKLTQAQVELQDETAAGIGDVADELAIQNDDDSAVQ